MFLLFDAYGTLLELDEFVLRLQNGFAQRGLPLPFAAVERAAHCEMRHYIRHAARARDEASREFLRRECAGVLAASLVEQEYSVSLDQTTIQEILVEAIVFRAFPETHRVLRALREHNIPMGVLSNWDFGLAQELEKLELLPHFRFVLTSAQAGSQKPEYSFFAQALRNAQAEYSMLNSSDCYYIGDHYEKDVLGARDAGLTPIWLVREARDIASGEIREPTDRVLRIASLDELLHLVTVL